MVANAHIQPPKKAAYEDPPDMPISLRLKYGIHTFFLLVEPLAPFSTITTELLFAVRDRSEPGLKASTADPPQFPPPAGKDARVSYSVMRNPNDPSKGWKDLQIQGDETPVSKGLKNNTVVAFVIQDANDADEPPDFVVQWPRVEEDDDLDEEMGQEDDEVAEKTTGKGKAPAVDEDDDLEL